MHGDKRRHWSDPCTLGGLALGPKFRMNAQIDREIMTRYRWMASSGNQLGRLRNVDTASIATNCHASDEARSSVALWILRTTA